MNKIKTIIKKILKIFFKVFIILLILLSIHNCRSINKGKKIDPSLIINNQYVNEEMTMYLMLNEKNGRIRINEDDKFIIINFSFEIDNGVVSCVARDLNVLELVEFSFIVLKDNSLYCKYFNEVLYKVIVEV